MIRKLVLENWRSHAKSEFIFSRGTNVIIGRMGAGKSSAMDALCFALFGTFPALQSRKIKLDDCIMAKPEVKQNARVKLELEIGDEVYTIVREIKRGKGTGHIEVRKGDTLIEGGNAKRTNDVIEKILGISYDLFSKAIYSEQNNIDYFLQIPAGKRKQKIDELLGIDRFEEARKNAISIKNRIKDRVLDRKRELDSLFEESVDEKIKEVQDEIQKIRTQNLELEGKLGSIIKELEDTRERISRLEKIRDRISSLQREIEGIRGMKKTIKERINGYKDRYGKFLEINLEAKLAEKKEIMQELVKSIETLNSELRQIAQKTASLNSKAREARERHDKKLRLEESIRNIDGELKGYSGIKEKLQNKKKEKEEIVKERSRLNATLERERERLSGLEKAEGECPVCGSDLPDEKRKALIDKTKGTIEESLAELKEIENKINSISKEINNLETRQLRMLDLEGKKRLLEEELNGLELIGEEEIKREIELVRKEEEEKKARLKELEAELEKVRNLVSKMERLIEIAREIENGERRIAELNEKETKIRYELEGLSFDQREYENAKEKEANLMENKGELSSSIDANKRIIQEKDKLLSELKEKKRRIENLKEDVNTLERVEGALDVMASALESSQVALREEFIEAVNGALDDIWTRLYPYGDYRSCRLGVKEKDYVLQLQGRDGNWVNVEGIASGGERSTAALALRVAFSLVLTQNLGLLILDEPTHNLDKEGVRMLARTLKEHLPSLVEQTFIITHDDEMERAVSGTMYKLERDKGKDEPTIVTMISSGTE